MPEAYEVGITLALQDGVSAGIQLIQRDLALLDRAIAATSQNLTTLGAKRGTPKSAPVLPASPGPFADELSNAAKPLQSSASDSSGFGLDAMSEPISPPVAPSQGSSPEPSASTMVRQAADAGSVGPANTGPLQRPTAPVEQTGVAVAPKVITAANVDGSVNEAVSSAGGTEATLGQPRSVAPADTPQGLVTPNPQRRIGPVLPNELPPASTDASAFPVSPRPVLREPKAERVSAATSAAPVDDAYRLGSSPAPRRKAETGTAAAPVTRPSPPAPQAPSAQMREPLSSASERLNREPTPSSSPRYSPTSRAPEAREQSARVPRSEPTRDGGGKSQNAAVAPSAAGPQALTMQGDIIIDGTRLGRWMTNALARQASRPSSGPVAPDPRQTPLWSGQAQGF